MFPSRLLTSLFIAVACLASAAEKPTSPLDLWPTKAPGALGDAPKDMPTLTPYWPAPEKATGAAFIVCPGGGYRTLAPHEDEAFAKWLVSQGIAAFSLKYRLTVDGYTVPTTCSMPPARCDWCVRTPRSGGSIRSASG